MYLYMNLALVSCYTRLA